jgi:uncharacterized protein YbaR (Trm112 family)
MDKKLLALLVCPVCKGRLELKKQELWCYFDKLAFPIRESIPMMLTDEARSLSIEEWENR